MKIKTSELIGPALDWAMAKCEGFQMMYFDEFWRMRGELKGYDPFQVEQHLEWQPYRHQHVIIETYTLVEQDGNVCKEQRAIPISRYSTDWAQGGPIIQRERIAVWSRLRDVKLVWMAEYPDTSCLSHGPTPLIAAMRCNCASKLGEEVDVPEEVAR